MNKICFLILTGILLCLNSGCSGSKIVTGYVEGVITLNGEVVSGATITFSPQDSNGQPAFGYSNENGVYKLTTEGGRDEGGAIPGDYRIAISKSNIPVDLTTRDNDGKARTSLPPGVSAQYEALVPKKYNDPSTSGLTAIVKKGKNTIPFELTE